MFYQGAVVFQQLGFIYPHHKALVLLQRALRKCKQMNYSQHHYLGIIKSPTVVLLCFSRLPHLPVLRISAHTGSTHHSAALPVQVSTREEDFMPGIHCCSAQSCVCSELQGESPRLLPAKAQAPISTACVQHLLPNTNLVSATITLLHSAWPEIPTILLLALNN